MLKERLSDLLGEPCLFASAGVFDLCMSTLVDSTYRGIYSPSSGIWAARARKVDRAKSYNYVTRALANVREKNVRDQKVFKVD